MGCCLLSSLLQPKCSCTLFAWLVLLASLGCGGPSGIEIHGQVTYEGEQVAAGEISFVPLDGSGPPEAGVIENGKYTLRAALGKKRVVIRASRPLPPDRQSSPEMGLLYEDFIPGIYNEESTLTAEVSKDGSREIDFHLTAPQ